MRWAEKQRISFICDHLAKRGWVGRKPIMDKFGVSLAQAANDLGTVRRLHPGLMNYDKQQKRYVVAPISPSETRENGQ